MVRRSTGGHFKGVVRALMLLVVVLLLQVQVHVSAFCELVRAQLAVVKGAGL